MVFDFEAVYEEVSAQTKRDFVEHFNPFDNIDTIATHGGYEPREMQSLGCPVVAPITLSTTFQQESPGVAKYDYSRAGNFSREALEKCIAKLEHGDHCSVFSSGLAALGAVVQLLSTGDHIIAFDDLYGGSGRYLRTIASKAGVSSTPIDLRDLELLKTSFQPNTKMVLLETPSNPLMRLVDIEAVSQIAHAHHKDILVVVDNTFMSAYFQRPLDFGADIVLHSLTKYMNGHSDVVMGALVTRNHPDLPKKFAFTQLAGGAVPSPFDCFLCLRGLRTLPVRMRGHMLNALILANFLERHPKVQKVVHPGLHTHPQHALARKQMRGYSGMITIYLRCSAEQTKKFVQSLEIFCLAESLGGYESLVEIPSIMTHTSVPSDVRQKNGILDNMVRLSIGLEDPKDLAQSLFDGLEKLQCD